MLVAERRRERNAQDAAGLGASGADCGVGLLYVGQNAVAGLVVGGAFVGEVKAPRGAVYEPDSKPPLKCREPAADHGGRHAEVAGGGREAARPDDPCPTCAGHTSAGSAPIGLDKRGPVVVCAAIVARTCLAGRFQAPPLLAETSSIR